MTSDDHERLKKLQRENRDLKRANEILRKASAFFAHCIVAWRVWNSLKTDLVLDALAETINGLYKTEVIRSRGPWRSMDAVEFVTLQWVDWINNRRLLEPIGDVPPAEFEQAYYDELERQAVAA